MMLDLPNEDIDFIMQVLQNQPLPFVRTAPIINRIGLQIVEAQKMAPLPEIAG
jgi:hypothetical protein